jgi:hypothetical protein
MIVTDQPVLIACAQTTETVFPSEPRLNVSLRSGYGPLLHLETAAMHNVLMITLPLTRKTQRDTRTIQWARYWDPTRRGRTNFHRKTDGVLKGLAGASFSSGTNLTRWSLQAGVVTEF